LNAGIDTNLNSGTYYLIVKGVGNINHPDYSSLGFYSINGSIETLLLIRQFDLKGNSKYGNHSLNWNLVSDEDIKNIFVEVSPDGKTFKQLVALNAGSRNFNYSPAASTNYYYRIKAITLKDEKPYYSNIITIRNENHKAVQVMEPIVRDHISVNSNGNYSFRLFDVSGKLLGNGIIKTGFNNIEVKNTAKGILFLQLADGVNGWTEKLIKQ
jgi:hypothetical protein